MSNGVAAAHALANYQLAADLDSCKLPLTLQSCKLPQVHDSALVTAAKAGCQHVHSSNAVSCSQQMLSIVQAKAIIRCSWVRRVSKLLYGLTTGVASDAPEG